MRFMQMKYSSWCKHRLSILTKSWVSLQLTQKWLYLRDSTSCQKTLNSYCKVDSKTSCSGAPACSITKCSSYYGEIPTRSPSWLLWRNQACNWRISINSWRQRTWMSCWVRRVSLSRTWPRSGSPVVLSSIYYKPVANNRRSTSCSF